MIPTKIKDLIGNSSTIKNIIKSLQKPNNILLINGPSGCGKKFYLNVILEELNFIIFKYDNNINYLIDFVRRNDNPKKIIIINNINNFTKNEKEFFKLYIKSNNLNFIIFHNQEHNKYLISIKKYLLEFKFTYIDYPDFISFLNKYKLKLYPNVAIELFKLSQFSIFKLDSIIKDINKQIITLEDINKYKTIYHNKQLDSNIYESTFKIFNNDDNLFDLLNSIDNIFIPLMIQENYPQFLLKKNLYDIKLLDNFIKGDIIEHFIYNDYSWYLQNSYNFYTCGIIGNLCKGSNITTLKVNYSRDLTNQALKVQNKKNILEISNKLGSKNIYYVAHLISNLINKEDKLIEIIKKYNLTMKEIEIILRINSKEIDHSKKLKNIFSRICI